MKRLKTILSIAIVLSIFAFAPKNNGSNDNERQTLFNGETILQYTKPQIGGGVVNSFDPAIKIDGKPLTEGL